MRIKRTTWLFAVALLWGAGMTSAAAAQETAQASDAARIEQARAAYDEGAQAFGRGRFAEALDRFTRAYELSDRPELLYNIATSHDRHGHPIQALRFYREYLAALPDAENREYTEARILVLESDVAATTAAEAHARENHEAAEPEPEPEPVTESPSPTPAIALLSIAGASAIAAVVTGIVTLGRRSNLDSSCPDLTCGPEQQDDIDGLRRMAITTDVLIGVAALAAITGTVLLIVGGGDDDDASVSCGLSGCEARVRF